MDHNTLVTILLGLLALSETLGGIKSVADNSIYQVIIRIMKMAKELLNPSAPAVVTQ